MLTGLDHIQIAMPAGREEEARAFYGGLLGLAEIAKPVELASRGGCWFALPRGQLHLGVEDGFNAARKAHPAFLVKDLEKLRARLAAAGVPLVADETIPTAQRFYASDPFGNRLEFIQNGQGFSQPRN